jgi:hypothetical protein
MKNEIVILLDSILDDYYFLWECHDEYKKISNSDYSYPKFLAALKVAYKDKLFNFFIGEKFTGDEKLIPDFDLNSTSIENLLDSSHIPTPEIRITTSSLGIDFLQKNNGCR